MKIFLGNFFVTLRFIFWQDKLSVFFVYGSLLLILISWGLLWWLSISGQTIYVLHYNAFMGIDYFINLDAGDRIIELFIAPMVGIIIWLINLIIAGILYFQSGEVEKTEKRKRLAVKNKGADFLGARLIQGSILVAQTAVLVYSIAILFANRF